LYCVLKKAEKRVKIGEVLEEDVLRKGIEKINRDEEMERLKEENKEIKLELKKRDEEIKKIKEEKEKEREKFGEKVKKRDEEIKKQNEENKKVKQEIIILLQELKKSKKTNDNKRSIMNYLYYILFSFSVFGLEVVSHPHPERFSLCGNILSFITDEWYITIYLKPTITSVC
jgi:hypothetical protein